ncbi:DciA family protein [Sandaracinobacter sp. RS1-74]|uniref:DUF721 domain-containing protein n=1 Tax=Sandaracinobacteroides sayramensis TaxID=2913411 RepID=UPI001EDB5EAA|nr:DciA family protein [Sandaracinobacteroides sayramensis]MCG2842526.1 DciA family protein [Sandaracinobacteroides sayramensis]
MAKPPKQPAPAPPRRNGVREVGALLPEVGGVAFRRFGFTHGALLARWRDVVGPVYARWSVPETLRFPRGQTVGGTLTVRVEGPFALQVQHVAPQLIERVNRILGHNAVAKLKLVQGEVPRPPASPAPPPAERPAESNLSPLGENALSGVKDDGLRSALQALADELARSGNPPRIG